MKLQKIFVTLFLFTLVLVAQHHSRAQSNNPDNDKSQGAPYLKDQELTKSQTPPEKVPGAIKLKNQTALIPDAKPRSKGLRVVSLSPAITEIIHLLGAETHLVGTTNHSNYPESAKKIPTVGDYLNPNIEKIVSLKPNLVLINDEWPESIFDSLRRVKISFKVLPLKNLEDLGFTIDALGEVLSRPESAFKLKTEWAAWRQQMVLKSQSLTKNKSAISAIYLVEANPLIAVGESSYLSELMGFCGFKNQIALAGYPKIERETLVNLKPEMIVYFDNMVKPANRKTVKSQIHRLLPNVKIVFANGDSLSRLTPSLAKATSIECDNLNKQSLEPL